MDSYHPDYLYGFTNACVEQGLDADTTALLAKHAQHQDAINNSPEYREGFENAYVKTGSAWSKIIRGVDQLGRGIGGIGSGVFGGLGSLLNGTGGKSIRAIKGVAKALTKTPVRTGTTIGVGGLGAGGYAAKKYHDLAEQNAPFNVYTPSFLNEGGGSGGNKNKGSFDFVDAMDAHLIDGKPLTSGGSSGSGKGGLGISSDVLGRVKDFKSTIGQANDRIGKLQTTINAAAGSNDPAKVIEANQARAALRELTGSKAQAQQNLEKLMQGIESEQGLMRSSARTANEAATKQIGKLLPELQKLQGMQDRNPTLWDKLTGNTPEYVSNRSTELARTLQALQAAQARAKQRMDFEAVQ